MLTNGFRSRCIVCGRGCVRVNEMFAFEVLLK